MSAVNLDRDYVRVSDSSSYKPVESVEVTPALRSGASVATLSVDGVGYELFAPDVTDDLQGIQDELAQLKGTVAEL